MKDTIYTFNKFFYDFLKALKKSDIITPQAKEFIKKEYKACNYETDSNIIPFTESMAELDLCRERDSFKKLVVFGGFPFSECVSEDIPDIFISHLYILVLFGYLYVQSANDELFNLVINSLNGIQKGGSYDVEKIMDDEILTLLSNIKSTIQIEKVNDTLPSLEKTKIGEIAKEIANELNFKDCDIKDPADMLKNNGDMLGKIVSNVSSKLQKKFEDGSIKHEELLSEAMSVIGSLGGGNQGDMLANLFKTFASGQKQKSTTKKIRRK